MSQARLLLCDSGMPIPSELITTLSPQDEDRACLLVRRIHSLALELAGHHLKYANRTRLERLILRLDDCLVPLTSGVAASRAVELYDTAIGTCRRLGSMLAFLGTANVLTKEQHLRVAVLAKKLERLLLDRRERALTAAHVSPVGPRALVVVERPRRTGSTHVVRSAGQGRVPNPTERHGDAAAAPTERAMI